MSMETTLVPPELELEGSTYISIITASMLYGIYVICYFTTLVFMTRSKKINRFQKWFYVAYSSILFAVSTAGYAGLAFVGQSLWILNRTYPGGPPAYFLAYQNTPFSVVTNVLETVINVLADGLLIYRCFVIYEYSYVIIILPVLCLCAFTSSFIAIQYLMIAYPFGYSTQFWNKMISASYAMTISINVIVTVLIVRRLLLHRSKLKNVLGTDTMRLYTGVTAIFVESAVPICVFGILSSATILANSQTSFFFSTMWTMTCALSPQLLILRVTMGMAWNRETIAELKTGTTMSFAVANTEESPTMIQSV